MANDVQLFKGAGLLTGDLAKYKQALQRTQATAPQIGGIPILKLGKDGVWRYGQTDTEVQDGSEWAINPTTFKKGYIAWAKEGGTKPLGKVLQPILLGNLPTLDDLPDVGADWTENVYFELTCLNGDDEGKTVAYASNAMGGVEAFHVLVAHLIHQIEVDPSQLVPIVTLTNQGYQHSNRSFGIKGWIVKPVFDIVEWVSNGEAPAEVGEEEEEQSEEQQQTRAAAPPRNAAPPRGAAAPTRQAAPGRGAASARGGTSPAREAPPERTAPRGPVPARGSAIPRNAPAANGRAAAPSRRGAAAPDTSSGETIVPDGADDDQPEVTQTVVRRRRRVVSDVVE